jgi:molybdopterin converting factor subunit 1
MTLRVLLFATLRDRLDGQKSIEIDLPTGATVLDLKARLAETFPALKDSLSTVIIAIDHAFAFDADVVRSGAEVALFPPVSGG